jgi:hypothetical protein
MIGLGARFRFLRPSHRSLCDPHKTWPRRTRWWSTPRAWHDVVPNAEGVQRPKEFCNLEEQERTDGLPPLMLVQERKRGRRRRSLLQGRRGA